MADSAGCCNKTEWELLVAILEQEQASFDRLQQVIDILASPSGGGATAANQINCAQKTQIVDALCNAVAVTGNALDVNLKTGDIEIGAVEIKNSTTDDRATVNASGQLSVIAVAQPGVDIGDVTVNNAAGASAVNIQDGGNSLTVDLPAVTTGGTDTFHLVSAASTNPTVIKASAGQVYGWYIYNSNASARKVAFHNASAAPTAGAAIFFTLVIPAASGANVFTPHGIVFSTGIAMTTVTGLADADATAVAANDLIINVWYK